MRLTLRTMLAYLDDVLDPADAHELRKKIGESDFASGLADRIRGVMTKLRMDAPKVDAKGMGNDANTVAEYLDSALEQDRVAEFERVCLESDKHLCEVAACHQILTIVLGKPADVPTELRERVYALGDPEKAVAHSAAGAIEHAARRGAPPASENGRPGPQPTPLQVPEYLRSSRHSSLWPVVGVMAAALVLILIVLATVGPLKDRLPLAALFGGGHQLAQKGEEATTEESPTPKTDTAVSQHGAVTPVPEALPTSAATEPAAAVATNLPTTEPAPAAAADAAATAGTERVAAAPLPAGPGPGVTEGTTTGAALAASTATVPPAADIAATAAAPATAVAVVPRVPKKTQETPKVKPVEVGRYMSDAQLLATLDPEDGVWYAKRSQEILSAGERLVVLPPSRPQIALPSAVQLTFAGEGALTMQPPDENRTPRVSIDYGRFLVATAGREGAQVQLDLAGIKGLLTLIDADSELAIKVARWVAPGSDPEVPENGALVVEMYNRNGRATWQSADQPKVDIPARMVYVYYADVAPELHGPFYPPEWIDAKNIKPQIDRDASIALMKLLDFERPLVLSLQEAMKFRKVEVRSLAARCLAALDEFEPILRELGDPEQRSFWVAEFEALRQAISRSPETAAKVHQTVNLARAADSTDIWRLLWSYNEEQLKSASSQLIKYLDHDQLDVRVLAYANLVTITGMFGSYLPERPAAQRKAGVVDWAKRRDKGAIIYKAPPSPLDTYKPVAAPGGDAKAGAAAVGSGMK